jgi:uncharacterized membrane protein YjgN (DUF898 family)
LFLRLFPIFATPSPALEDSPKGDPGMTVADHVDTEAGLAPPRTSVPPSPVRLRFIGRTRDYWRLMIRGTMLQAITLGIYRFWLSTDMRRFLWGAIDIQGDTPDYTGTALELLIGFLIAIGILIPIYVLFFVASLEFGILSELSGIVAFVGLAAFGQYAAYRTRRYRLTRTVFRGLRFHQTGSAGRYAVRAMLWWIPTVLTLGLAWPWALANLERCKMRNTFYGDLGGSFAGSGGRLFSRGILLWLLAVAPLAAGLVAAAVVLDWPAVKDVLEGMADVLGDDEESLTDFLKYDDSVKYSVVALIAGATSSALIGGFLFPAYQAIVMRWWLGGLRLGGAAAASDLRIGRYYGAWLRYLLYVLLFSIAFAVAGGLVLGVGYTATLQGLIDLTPVLNGLIIATPLTVYVIYILGIYTIYQVVVKMRLWQAAVESMLVSGYAALDHVRAREADSSAVGEGLTDALGGGGI